jgi:Methylamine utilization protein MauJ
VNKAPSPISAQVPVTGLPGQNGNYILVPDFPEGDPRNRSGPGGMPGEYEVTFTLNRPGYALQPERSASTSDSLEGDSHLQIPAIFHIGANVEGETFTFEGRPNSRRFLASLVVRCDAKSIKDAHDKCYTAIMPILSLLSLKWDVPLAIYQVDVHEIRRGTRGFSHRNPFLEVAIKGTFTAAMDQESRTYAAIYREAITTESMTYQFLCFYRLIESVQARRTRLERAARGEGVLYKTPIEVYPKTRDEAANLLSSLFPSMPSWHEMALDAILVPDAVGKAFGVIKRDHLKPVRDNIAHTLLQRAEELISMDDPLAQQKVGLWLPAIKCIALAMIKTEFGFLFV